MNMKEFKEKRKFLRLASKLPVRFLYRGSFHGAVIDNIGLGGMEFITKSPLLINSDVQFILDLPFNEEIKRCVLLGKIIRASDEVSGIWFKLVCSFRYSSAISLKILGTFLKSAIRTSIKKKRF